MHALRQINSLVPRNGNDRLYDEIMIWGRLSYVETNETNNVEGIERQTMKN